MHRNRNLHAVWHVWIWDCQGDVLRGNGKVGQNFDDGESAIVLFVPFRDGFVWVEYDKNLMSAYSRYPIYRSSLRPADWNCGYNLVIRNLHAAIHALRDPATRGVWIAVVETHYDIIGI